MILTENGVLKLMQRIKSFITSQLNTKAASVHTHSISEIDDLESQLGGGYTKSEVDTLLNGKSDTSHTHTKSQITDFPSYGTTANTICEGNDSRLSDARTPTTHTHTKSEITDFPSLATVATSGSYNDLSNKPTIPTVNNATLTIQKNGTDVKTFTANASSDVTCNITVPTKTSELTNDSGFLTSHQSLSNYSTLANTIKSLSISGKTITYTKGDDTTGTLTTQDTVYTHPTSSGNKHIPSGGSSGQFLGWSADGTAKWVNNPNTNTWTAMVGATSSSNGSVGYVNAVPPKDGYNTKYLRADGTWQVPPDHTYTVNNATLTIQKNGTNVATFTSNSNTDVTANISVPTKTSDLTNDSGFLTSHQDLSGYVPKAGGAVTGNIDFDSTWNYASSNQGWFPASISFVNSSSSLRFGFINIYDDSSRAYRFFLTDHTGNEKNILSLGIDSNNNTFITGYNNKAVAMQEDFIPRSGGPVISGNVLYRTVDTGYLGIGAGTTWHKGGLIEMFGVDYTNDTNIKGLVRLQPALSETNYRPMCLYPSGTWTWDGTACQITSDQRLKQQINQIDDKLLDAWEDVTLVQFKYNDAVNEKGNQARLHTGYVVQQIDTACKSHNVDISEYGLYCHEEYPERTEEVEIEQADGTKAKETRVIREASEHYSLRYTETLVVECAYLRRENKRLNDRLTVLEELFKQYIAK